MFELQKLMRGSGGEIVVQTKTGRSIQNSVALPPSEKELRDYEVFRRDNGSRWINRKPACGTYNCMGMLFASRRTAIYDAQEVPKILKDDGYRPLKNEEPPRIDDIVMYSSTMGEYFHGGRIIKVEPLVYTPSGGDALFNTQYHLTVLSKWNDCFGEDQHSLRDVQYAHLNIPFETVVYTDRL
jgi:hypothetical protein